MGTPQVSRGGKLQTVLPRSVNGGIAMSAKVSCPVCGRVVEGPGSAVGQVVDCPTCGEKLRLWTPANEKPDYAPQPQDANTGGPPERRRSSRMFPFPANRMILPASLIAVATLASLIAYLLLRPSPEPVQALPCEVLQSFILPPSRATLWDMVDRELDLQSGSLPPAGTRVFEVSDFEVKVLDSDVKLPRFSKDVAERSRMARVQWRCKIKNIWKVALHYILQAELLDKDGFILITRTVDSDHTQGDLPPAKTHTIYDELAVEYSRTRSWASCRITIQALETSEKIARREDRARAAMGHLRQTRDKESADRIAKAMADLDRESREREQEWERKRAADQLELEQNARAREDRARAAKQEQRRLIDLERAKWMKLKQGMSKQAVEALLGKPLGVSDYVVFEVWEYAHVEGSYAAPEVQFTPSGAVKGWRMP